MRPPVRNKISCVVNCGFRLNFEKSLTRGKRFIIIGVNKQKAMKRRSSNSNSCKESLWLLEKGVGLFCEYILELPSERIF